MRFLVGERVPCLDWENKVTLQSQPLAKALV